MGAGRERGARPSSSITNLSLGRVEEEEEEGGALPAFVDEAVEAGWSRIEEEDDDVGLSRLPAAAATVADLGGGTTST